VFQSPNPFPKSIYDNVAYGLRIQGRTDDLDDRIETALRRAALTVAVLYPVGYAWDWYTLAVGVFEVHRRTGLDLLGIPVEEHLFIVVVPALVVGVHETLRDRS